MFQVQKNKSTFARRKVAGRSGGRRSLRCEALEARRVLTSYLVNTTADTIADDGVVSLREALQAANTNASVNSVAAGDTGPGVVDTISFDAALSGMTIALSGTELSVSDNVSIELGAAESITVDAGGSSRVFAINTGTGAASISGLSIVGGSDVRGGGVYVSTGESLSLVGVTISQNIASGDAATEGGGGLFNDGGTVNIVDSLIAGNQATGASGSGGGLFSLSGSLTVEDSQIAGNVANRAGGGIELGVGDLTLTNVALGGIRASDGNIAGPSGTASPGNGGGLHVTGDGGVTSTTVNVIGGAVQNNFAAREGGGLWNQANVLMTVSGGTLIGNNVAAGPDVDDGGGGIFNNGGELIVDGVELSNNSVTGAMGNGGAVSNVNGGTANIINSDIADNFALGSNGSGGGIANLSASVLSVTNTEISGNVASRAGGGIEDASDVAGVVGVTLTNVELSGNNAGLVDEDATAAAPGNGGGLHVTGAGDVVITGGLVASNIAASEGGGLWNGTGTMSIDGTSIRRNVASGDDADTGGGGVFSVGGDIFISNSSVELNVADGDAGSGGGILNDGGNLTVTDTTISSNRANRAGGGIEATAGSTTTLENVQLDLNDVGPSPGNGGGLHITGDGNVTITGGTVIGNTAAREGGGLWNGSGTMTVNGTLIDGNIASGDAADDGGGGVFNNGGTLVISNATISNNVADGSSGSGGGVLNLGGALSIEESSISGNQANRAGGGIEVTGGSVTTIEDTSVSSNLAGISPAVASPGNGGGVHIGGNGRVTILGGDVTGNQAVEGGGLWNSPAGRLVVDGTTIASNSAVRGGGIYNEEAEPDATQEFELDFIALNDSGVSGSGTVTVSSPTTTTREVRVVIDAEGLEDLSGIPGAIHVAHIHGQFAGNAVRPLLQQGDGPFFQGAGGTANGFPPVASVPPTLSEDDGRTIEDGFLDFLEGRPKYGPVVLNLTSTQMRDALPSGSNPPDGVPPLGHFLALAGGGNINPAALFPSGTEFNLDTTYTFDLTDADEARQFANIAPAGLREIVLHGKTIPTTISDAIDAEAMGAAPGGVALGDGTSFRVTAPIGVSEITAVSGAVTVTDATITDNTATGDEATDGGGGIHNLGTLTVDRTSITNNVATGSAGSGGGLLNGSLAKFTDTVISGNTANRAGGGIEATAGSTTTLVGINLDANEVGSSPGNGGGLHITGAGNATIDGGTVRGNTAAREGGGLWNGSGTMTVTATLIEGNTASGDAGDDGGGGIFNNGGTLRINDAVIRDNVANGASGSGGGLFSLAGEVTIDNTTIAQNGANRAGGGIEIVDGDLGLTATDLIDNDADGTITGGVANPGNGGGLHVSGMSGTTVTIDGGIVSGNSAGSEGGGLWNQSGSTLRVQNGIRISGNVASGDAADNGGGGIFNNGGTVEINDALINENSSEGTAGSGGGIFNDGGIVTVIGTEISGNSANRAGGGIESNGEASTTLTLVDLLNNDTGPSPGNGGGLHITGPGDVQIVDSTVSGNTATNEGGGLWNSAAGVMTVDGSTIVGNQSPVGGGVFNDGIGGDVTLINSTVSKNIATGSGGGIATEGGTTSLISVTVAENVAATGGGLANLGTRDVSITNTIVDGNSAAAGPDVSGSVAGDFNLISNTNGAAVTGVSNILDVSAALEPLADNGGPTLTHALMPASAAVNAGTLAGLDVDQRNVDRPQDGAADIGSFESESVGTVDAPLQNQIAPLDVTGDGMVSQVDVFRIINFIYRNNRSTGLVAGELQTSDVNTQASSSNPVKSFVDVSGDNRVTPIDVLRVVNALNRNRGAFEVDAVFESGDESELGFDAGSIAIADMFGDSDDEKEPIRSPVSTIGVNF
tara:strand:+ start:774565 stop:780117 length:5553 start_codon:yes stop_codon:yes gene_type:complete